MSLPPSYMSYEDRKALIHSIGQRMLSEYPDLLSRDALDKAGKKMSSAALAAKNLRKMLKKAYPKVKFSISSEYYSGGSTVSVEWDEDSGFTHDDLKPFEVRFEYGTFDGQSDNYDYDRDIEREAFRSQFGSTKYMRGQVKPLSPQERAAKLHKELESEVPTMSKPRRGPRL